jgi:4-amino-4-deoxy-L-arabinose transferase
MRLTIPWVLVAMFLFLYVLPLGVRPMVIPDEVRYGEVPREMLASGDWIVPRLNGLRYFEKPPLGYWLNAASIRLFGPTAFAVRLPSAVSVGLTALLLFLWARRFADDKDVPLLATTVFLLSFEVLAVGTFSVFDSMLSLFTTGTIVCFHLASASEPSRRRIVLLVLTGVACGLAFLTKGFLALVVPALAIVPFMIGEGRCRTLPRMVWLPLLTAVLLVLPWAMAIHRREPDFWHYFFWVEHVNRFLSPSGGQHPQPFWFYVPFLLGGAMPWTPLLGTIIQGLRSSSRKEQAIRLALCWLAMPFLFFSACRGKLGTYILPCFPPLAFLIAVGTLRCLRAADFKGFARGAAVVVVVSGLSLLALLAGLAFAPEMCQVVTLARWSVLAAGLLLWVVFSLAAVAARDLRRKLALYSAGPVLFMFSWAMVSPAVLKTAKTPGTFLLSNAENIPANSILITDNALTASVCWYYGRSDAFIVDREGEFGYGLAYEDGRHRFVPTERLTQFIRENTAAGCVVLIAREDRYREEYEPFLPPPARVVSCQKLAFVVFGTPLVPGGQGRDRIGVDAADHHRAAPAGYSDGGSWLSSRFR